jgi:hypothetical protein
MSPNEKYVVIKHPTKSYEHHTFKVGEILTYIGPHSSFIHRETAGMFKNKKGHRANVDFGRLKPLQLSSILLQSKFINLKTI